MSQYLQSKYFKTDLQRWRDCPSPNGYFWYLGMLIGASWAKRALNKGSIRDAQGFVGWNKLYTWLQDGLGGGPLKNKY